MSVHTRRARHVRGGGEREGGGAARYSPDLLAGTSFVVASLIGGFVAILASPMIQLRRGCSPSASSSLRSARRSSGVPIWPTVLTGLAIGLAQSSFTKLQTDFSWFPKYGAREGLPFLVIIVAMVLLGERFPERGRRGLEAAHLPPPR